MLKTVTFSVGQNVRLTRRASKIYGGDKKVHSVKKVDLIPEDLYEGTVAKLLQRYPHFCEINNSFCDRILV